MDIFQITDLLPPPQNQPTFPKIPVLHQKVNLFRLSFDIILQLDEQLSVRSDRKPLFKRWKVVARLRTKSRQFLSSVHHASLTAQKRWEESPMKLCRAGWHTHISENPCHFYKSFQGLTTNLKLIMDRNKYTGI